MATASQAETVTIDRPARPWPSTSLGSMRELREVYFVDGVRSAFGRAGPTGVFWRTRADDMAVKLVRELLRRDVAPGCQPVVADRRGGGEDDAVALPRRRRIVAAQQLADGSRLRRRPYV